MELNSWTLCSPTQKSNFFETSLAKSTAPFSDFLRHCDDYVVENNKRPLSVVYNEAIEFALENGSDCLILVHDDVTLEHDPIPKLKVLFDQFDLVGVAGTTKAEIQAPALWHLMGGGFQSGNLRGAVAHSMGNQRQMSSFGPYPAQVLMIDGVFMALSRKLMESGIRFDETNPASFHFYDIDFASSCHQAGFKVGVGDIFITHESPGLREFTVEFLAGQEWFLNKHGR